MEPAFQKKYSMTKKRGKCIKQANSNFATYQVSPHTERIFKQNKQLISEFKRKKA
ncbi:type II toxin-antitoxin system SpoIISB family antitoxin [Bacillus changyiensis]|uniref:type II toxin-antitoxin system SpoIISB family antitoxin n=1 Tax=Bacillus changyiensis TaxID=3004103 RepID=UPI0022E10D1B|nr:type II toxin-antitoxin system SpoIISB family antitoxin [Bacillus changyiensis]MDA1475853.1 type II toxin-antitoxin system SpoIISB family antitoxin [Bacillus changyiensis]